MSSAERGSTRLGAAGLLLALLAGVPACASEAEPAEPTATGVSADDTTRRIAQVEFERLCRIGSTSFADEAGLTTDLDDRLAAAGFTHQQWKDWHDALADSPELVDQFAEISTADCAGG